MLSEDRATLTFARRRTTARAPTVGGSVGEMFAAPGGIAVTDLSTGYVMWRNRRPAPGGQGGVEYMFGVIGAQGPPPGSLGCCRMRMASSSRRI